MRRVIISLFLVFALLGGQAYAVPTPEKPVELTMSSSWLEQHPGFQLGFKPWIEEVQKRTNGAVKITFYNPGTLCPEKEIFSAVTNGTIDIGFTILSKTPGKFPLGAIIDLPLLACRSSESTSRTIWALYNKYPEWAAEYKGVKMLAQFGAPPLHVYATKGFVKTMEDFKGKKFITFSPLHSEMIKAFGGSAVAMLSSETYMALERGMADGIFNTLAVARADKTSEVAKYTTLYGLGSGAFFVAMNQNTWDSLGPEIQKVFGELCGEALTIRMGKAMDLGGEQTKELMGKEGQQYYPLPESEGQRLYQAVLPIHEKFLNDMEGKYKNVRSIYKDARELAIKYEEERLAGKAGK